MRRCKSQHRKCWAIKGGGHQTLFWCYECGAIRMLPEETHWTYPVGPDGENPAMRWTK